MPSRPTHFEIPVDDPDRAEKFYTTVFGWTIQRYPDAPQYYGLAGTGDSTPGIDGALYQRGQNTEVILTMSVDSIEDSTATILAEGGKVVQEKTPIPTMGWYATFLDTEGNIFGVFVNDPSAA
jgi:uncharacterized protein